MYNLFVVNNFEYILFDCEVFFIIKVIKIFMLCDFKCKIYDNYIVGV